MTVRLAPQVVEFVRNLAPQPRRRCPRHRLRTALRDLAKGRGDVRPLEGPLQDYCRLRVGPYRVVLRYTTGRVIECVFAERRSLVYEIFADMMIERLTRSSPSPKRTG